MQYRLSRRSLLFRYLLRTIAPVGTGACLLLARPAHAQKTPAVDAPTDGDINTFHNAARDGDVAKLKAMLAQHPKLLNARVPGGITALGRAVVHRQVESVRILLEAGAIPDLAKPDGAAPLHDAVNQRNLVILRLLLDHKANTEVRWQDGSTPLFAASADTTDDPATAKLLLDSGAKVDARTEDGRTPLHIAVRQGGAAVAALLLVHGADPNAADKAGNTPLLIALAPLITQDSSTTTPPVPSAPGGVALLDSYPLTLKLVNTPMTEVITQIFAPTKLPLDIDAKLSAPLTITTNGTLRSVLTTVKRMAKHVGQPFALAVVESKLRVSPVAATNKDEEWPVSTLAPRFRFFKKISQEVLENYLSRSVTHYGLCATSPEQPTESLEDDLRMLTELGAKFIGRVAYAWVPPDDDEAHYRLARERARRAHTADPEMILQACVFEAVYQAVEKFPVPAWVFEAFGLPVEQRNFRYADMLYDGGKYHNHWTQNASVPDMTKRETRMYFYYRARRYIDAGMEGIHFGQVHLMDENDGEHRAWEDLLTRVRAYAAQNARRRIVLCDAHTHGVRLSENRLLFDFHSWPLMARELKEAPQHARLEVGFYNSIYKRDKGGISPSGWACTALPYICEFDCGGVSGKPGQAIDFPFIWGYACGDWFAHQPRDYQRYYLLYAWDWLRALNENAWLQMPTRLNLGVNVDGVKMWQANRRSKECAAGFDLEPEIALVWKRNEPRLNYRPSR